jgi:hypothetical protein
MNASTGERLRPLPARDSRGRFVRVWYVGTPPSLPDRHVPASLESLLQTFEATGECRFEDPWEEGFYVIETRKSLKGYPVAMRYEGPLIEERRLIEYSCVVKYNADSWGSYNVPDGEVAVSPATHYGDPNDTWQGHWTEKTKKNKRQLASLYIHLAHSLNLHEYSCGASLGVVEWRDERRRRY